MEGKQYTKEECDAFNNKSHLKKLMEVSNEIKKLNECISNMPQNYITWTKFMWIFGGTMGVILIAGGGLYAQNRSVEAELGVYKSEMAKEIREISSDMGVASAHIGHMRDDIKEINRTLQIAEIE